MESLSSAPIGEEPSVDYRVDEENCGTQRELELARQLRRIKGRQQIALDEARLVTGASTPRAQQVFEWRERADPADKLDPCTPQRRREVQPRDRRPPEDEQAAEDDEEHEGDVDGDDNIRQCAPDHGPFIIDAVDLTCDLTARWSIGGKYAYRLGQVSLASA